MGDSQPILSATTGNVLISTVNPFTTLLSATNSYLGGSDPTFTPSWGNWLYYLFWDTSTNYSMTLDTYGSTLYYVVVGGGQYGETGQPPNENGTSNGSPGGLGGAGGEVVYNTTTSPINLNYPLSINLGIGGQNPNINIVTASEITSNSTKSFTIASIDVIDNGMCVYYNSTFIGVVESYDSTTLTVTLYSVATTTVATGSYISMYTNADDTTITINYGNNNTSTITASGGSSGNPSATVVEFYDNTGSLSFSGSGMQGGSGSTLPQVGEGGGSFGITNGGNGIYGTGSYNSTQATIIDTNFVFNTNIEFPGLITPVSCSNGVGQTGVFGGGGGGGGGGVAMYHNAPGYSPRLYETISGQIGGKGGSGLVLMYYQLPPTPPSTLTLTAPLGNQITMTLSDKDNSSVFSISNPEKPYRFWLDNLDVSRGFYASMNQSLMKTRGPITNGLDTIKILEPIQYTFHDNDNNLHTGFSAPAGNNALTNIIAREGAFNSSIGEKDFGINVTAAVPYTVSAIQELNSMLEQQKVAQAQQTQQIQTLQRQARLLHKQNKILGNLLLARNKR